MVVSYERFLDVVYTDLMAVYGPRRLRLSLRTNVGKGSRRRSRWTVTGRLEEGMTSSGTGSRGICELLGWPTRGNLALQRDLIRCLEHGQREQHDGQDRQQ